MLPVHSMLVDGSVCKLLYSTFHQKISHQFSMTKKQTKQMVDISTPAVFPRFSGIK